MTILDTSTVFSNRNDAEFAADINNRDSDGWEYRVERVQLSPPKWVVKVFDEHNDFVACL